MKAKYKILITDVDTIFGIGLRVLLMAQPDLEVISNPGNYTDIKTMIAELAPDLLITDLAMHDGTGVVDIAGIKQAQPRTNILLVTQYSSEETIRSTLCAGASGYVLKNDSNGELLTAVRSILEGKVYLSPSLSDHIINVFLLAEKQLHSKPHLNTLTKREREILTMVAGGHTNRSVAEHLSLSIKTVEKHRANMMKKLDLHNVSALTSFAIGQGLIVGEDS